MRGRKFFYFGSADGGQNWMDYLARPGEGNYLEIQSGIAPTQNQRFVLAAGAKSSSGPRPSRRCSSMPDEAHDPDYRAAVTRAGQRLDAVVPADELARVDAFLREQARLPLDRRYSAGAPWGMRQEQLLGRRLADGLDFAVDAPGDFWDDLATRSADRLPSQSPRCAAAASPSRRSGSTASRQSAGRRDDAGCMR